MPDLSPVNELGTASLVVTSSPQPLPAPLFGGPVGAANQGLPCSPRHAWITIENGDIRYRLDGSDVVEPFGILALSGSVIDWTHPLTNFAGFIKNMSVMAASPAPADGVLLNISWRD